MAGDHAQEVSAIEATDGLPILGHQLVDATISARRWQEEE